MKRILVKGIHGGKYTLIDEDDFERCKSKSWYMNHKGRPKAIHKIGTKWKQIFLHRFILGFPNGQIDHIDGNPLNNQKKNLRICSNAQNQFHRKPKKKSGFKGVCASGKKWEARITFKQKGIHLGTFGTKEEAAREYNKAAKKYFGDFAWLNPV